MKRISLILSIIFIVTTAFDPNAVKWLIQPAEKAVAFSPDSILSIVVSHKAEGNNNYYIAESFYDSVFRKIRTYEKMHLYSKEGVRLMIMPDDACGSPILFSSFATDLNNYPVVKEDKLSDMMSKFVAFSVTTFNKDYPTAILYWNRTLGLQGNDNVFNWEKAFKDKFHDKINIIKVNMDVIDSWEESKKKSF